MSIVSIQPRQRNTIAVDIEGSARRNNYAKAMLRADMYDLIEAALVACGITENLRDKHCDRGDGLIAFIRPVDQAPKTLLLNQFVPTLSDLLCEHALTHPSRSFRLRVAIHTGDVHVDQRGPFGEDVDITARLVDAPELKVMLSQTSAPLLLVVSDHIHRSVIRHGYEGIDESTFEPAVHLDIAGQPYRGWVQKPANERSTGFPVPRIDLVS